MIYKAQPGTTPYRVIAHLESLPAGTRLATSVLADELNSDNNTIHSCLKTAKRHGAIFASRDDDGNTYWSLGDGKPEAPAEDFEPDEPLHTRRKTTPMPTLKDPLFCAFSDGRMGIAADGQDITLSASTVSMLAAFISKWGEPDKSRNSNDTVI